MKRSDETKKKKVFMELEVDVIEEILFRVDAKSLLRLKCVCKLWYSLIKHPYFIWRHLKRPKEEEEEDSSSSSSDLIICSEFILFSDTEGEQGQLRSIVDNYRNLFLTKPGLICLFNGYFNSSMHIFNPATRESLFLPVPLMRIEDGYGFRAFLGFHPSTNHYKVLLFRSIVKRRKGAGHIWRMLKFPYDECHVFTLGGGRSSNSWRPLGRIGYCHRPAYRLCEDSSTCAVRGVLYWMVCLGLGRYLVRPDFIVSFDLGVEEFVRIPLPNFDGERKTNDLRLMEVRESVYLVDTYNKGQIDIWVLEDSPKKNYSWIKEYTIDLVDDIRLFGKLIWFCGDHAEILVIKTSEGIVYYDSRTKQITEIYKRKRV